MATTNSYGTSQNVSIPAPRVVISEEQWKRVNAHGDTMGGNRSLYLQVSDCPNEFFTDESLDARIELLRWKKHRHERSRTYTGEAAWRHPDCSVNPINGARTRGGEQVIPRQSSWLLHGQGYDDHSWIGRIQLEDYHYLRQIAILTGPSQAFKRETVPVISGSKTTSLGSWSPAQLDPENPVPKYNGQEMNARYAFRISIVNPDGDGTQGDRLAGPISRVVWCRPYPYPVWPTGDGYADGRSTQRLTISPDDGVAGN